MTLFKKSRVDDGEEWITISDLMAGLMIIFLFIAVVFVDNNNKEKEKIEQTLLETQNNLKIMKAEKKEAEEIWLHIKNTLKVANIDPQNVEKIWRQTQKNLEDTIKQKQKIRSIAIEWSNTQEKLYQRLKQEFAADLELWQAVIDRETLSVRFKEPTVLFAVGKADLKPRFAEILDDFFPRYLNVLQEFRNDLVEVRVEGHTSSSWSEAKNDMEAYFNNMILSQGRTLSVLRYCLNLIEDTTVLKWARGLITANGLSSSQLILQQNGGEDAARSRRVEFRLRTNAEKRIIQILQENIS